MKHCQSHPEKLDASVLNYSWVSVDCRTKVFDKKFKQHEEILFKLEDERYISPFEDFFFLVFL